MTSARIRPLLSDELLVSLRGAFVRNASPEEVLGLMTGDYAELYGDRWRSVAGQSEAIARRARIRLEEAIEFPNDLHLILDGTVVAEALAIATDEVLQPDILDHYEALSELEGLGHQGTRSLEEEYLRNLSVLEGQWMRNGLLTGKGRDIARLRALVFARSKVGNFQALHAEENIDVAMLGCLGAAAGSATFGTPDRITSDFEERLLGSAAVGAVMGFVHGWNAPAKGQKIEIEPSEAHQHHEFDDEQVVKLVFGRRHVVAFRKRLLMTLAPMTVRGAMNYLEQKIADPKTAESDRKKYELLLAGIEAAAHGRMTGKTSVGKLLGIKESAPETSFPVHTEAVYDAAPVGEYPPTIVCKGKAGRPLHCRALVNGRGHLVGYRAYDTLSREFTQEPLHIVYDLGGRRRGYVEEGRYVDGLRKRHIMTAPETLELLTVIEAKKTAV